MTEKSFDVLGIGNAMVDVVGHVDDAFLATHDLTKGAMTLVDEQRAQSLYAVMRPSVQVSGGSVANSMAGLASQGARVAYIGKVKADELGEIFTKDIRAAGVAFDVPPATGGPSTGRCLVLVSADAQRTMQTFLGASATLSPADVDPESIRAAQIVYLEGYMWDPEPAKKAFLKAAELAHGAGGRISLSLSDSFCVDRHRDEFVDFVARHVDILFANEDEIVSLYQTDNFAQAMERLQGQVELAGITRGAQGSVVLAGKQMTKIEAAPIERLVDTTGAGDLYASGFLYGLSQGRNAAECGRLGGQMAARIITQFGARLEG